ncbi:MAG TPA: thioredoxin domain-containing protein [Gemmatimonadaceae bacterium]|jgi:protein-disulfide isomerase
MRTTLVNGLAGLSFIAAVTIVSAACSNGTGRPAADSSHPGTSAGTSPMAARATTTDSLAKLADVSRIQGSPSAKIWVIEVSDFQCPYCKEWHDATYAMVVNDYVKTGKVRMAYVNFPLSIHAHAHQAAIAAMCAGAQDKFWQMHDALFASQSKWEVETDPTASFDSLATSVGVNDAQYKSCLSSPSIEALIAGDQERARDGGVTATPSFWVGGKLIEGAVPTAEMKAAIDQALAGAK